MKTLPQSLAALLLAAFLGGSAWAATTAQVTYADGSVSIKPAAGAARDLNIGDQVKTGDTVRTGADGQAELDQKGVSLKINPKTVFTLTEREANGQSRDVVGVAVGSIKMKYNKLSGQEPLIRTASCAAGVRGTEIDVFSGEDGGSLIAVQSGKVEISAEGKTVSLEVGEAVEVRPGKAPGTKFTLPTGQISYQSWNADRVKSMLGDPQRSLAELTAQLDSYARDTIKLVADYQDYNARLLAERDKVVKIKQEQGEDAFTKYRDEVVTPLSVQTAFIVLNMRYYALGALSLRRYVAGRLYLQLKPQSVSGAPSWAAFQDAYRQFLQKFERDIVPQLVEADI